MNDQKSYCECKNCGVKYLIMVPGEACPKCGTKVEVQEVEEW